MKRSQGTRSSRAVGSVEDGPEQAGVGESLPAAAVGDKEDQVEREFRGRSKSSFVLHEWCPGKRGEKDARLDCAGKGKGWQWERWGG